MTPLRDVLQNADPLPTDMPAWNLARARVRQAVVEAAADSSDRPASVDRRAAVLAVATASATVVAAGWYVWSGAPQVEAAVRFEARLAEEQPASGLTPAAVGDASRVIYLHDEVVLGNGDIARARAMDAGAGGFSVEVDLSPAASERLRVATSGHLGRPLAILIDGRVIVAPVVRSPIERAAVISGNFTKAEATRIAEGLLVR
jgi:preprotein translocase subunit SecD